MLTEDLEEDIISESKEKRKTEMLAKLTSKNQITIPKKVLERLPPVSHFDIEVKDGLVVMRPLITYDADLAQIREKAQQLGLTPESVNEAIQWARSR